MINDGKIDAVWLEEASTDIPILTVDYGLDDQTVLTLLARSLETGQFVVASVWRPREALQLEIGHIENFRFVESPLVIEEATTMSQRIVSKSKRGRQLNSKKLRIRHNPRPGYYQGGEKELERGVRYYTENYFPPIFNTHTGEFMPSVRRPGHGTLAIMSKKQFDRDVTYHNGDEQ